MKKLILILIISIGLVSCTDKQYSKEYVNDYLVVTSIDLMSAYTPTRYQLTIQNSMSIVYLVTTDPSYHVGDTLKPCRK